MMRTSAGAAAATALLVAGTLPTPAHGWSSAHAQISRCAFDLMPSALQQLWRTEDTFPPLGSSVYPIEEYITNMGGHLPNYACFSEAGDIVDGPCYHTPCAAPVVSTKLFLRQHLYGVNATGEFSPPWPYAIPACTPKITTGCILGPKTDTWTYHYFDQAPAENQRRAGAGAAWAISHAVAALRLGLARESALFLVGLAHGVEDRSSPYHAWGGDRTAQAAADARYNISKTCARLCPGGTCPGDNACRPELNCLLFWALDDGAPRWNRTASLQPHALNSYCPRPGQPYVPTVLGSRIANIGIIVGARMQAQALAARAIMVRPETGFIAEHLKDNWTAGASSAATDLVLGEMGLLSTQLVADIWFTALNLSHSSAILDGSICYAAMEAVPVTVPPNDACLTALGRAQVRLAEAGCTNTDCIAFCQLHFKGSEDKDDMSDEGKGGRVGAMADMALDRSMVQETHVKPAV